MKEALERAWAHVAWANGRVGETLEQAGEEAPTEALRLFGHLVSTERVWLDRIREGASDHPIWPAEGATPGVDGVLRLAASTVEEVRGILEEADEGSLARPVSYRNSSGRAFETALGDILLHVALHGSYHRGQVARALRQAGLEPVNTDYITFVREV